MQSLFNENFPFRPAKWPFFYGYVITACAILGMLLSVPGQTIGISVFTDNLISHLKISRFQLSMAYTLGTLISSLIIGRVGKLLDNIGPRAIATSATLALGGVLIVLSQVDHLAFFLIRILKVVNPVFLILPLMVFLFLCLRFFGQGILSLASRTMLMKWFVDLRGRMNSIQGVFVTLGFSAAPVFFEAIIHKLGWRGAWMGMGLAISCCFAGIVWLFFRNTPETNNLVPDGRITPVHQKHVEEEQNRTLSEAKRTYTFWIFNLSLAMFSLFITAVTFHIVSIYETAGFSRASAFSVFLPSSVMAVFLNLIAGWMSDWHYTKYRLKYLFIVMLTGLFLTGVGVVSLSLGWGRFCMILGLGLSQGLFATLVAVAWPRYFGRKHLGEIAGFNVSYLVFFSAIGPSIFGWSYQVSGHYMAAVGFCCLIVLGLLVAAFRADPPGKFEEKHKR